MSSDFTGALAAAQRAAADQHYPTGALYVVATPIGNLCHITLRALHVLQLVDRIACEDTRHTQALLRAYGIDKASNQLLALHQHNESEAAQQVIAWLQQGLRVAYVSDAGTPAISDPGARLVAALQPLGLRSIPLPGASSITTLLSAAGLGQPAQASGFVFAGFLPSKSSERAAAVQQLAAEVRAVVLLEAPHRIEDLAQALAVLGPRSVTLGRELSKQFEEIATMPAEQLPQWLAADSNRTRGEFVVALHPHASTDTGSEHSRTLQLLLEHLPVKTAVRLCADITGANRNALYAQALDYKKNTPSSD